MSIKPTPGPWEVVLGSDLVFVERPNIAHFGITKDDIDSAACVVVGPPMVQVETASDALLFVEAGTVFHEIGLTPRQLAEQRSELAAHLRALYDMIEDSMSGTYHREIGMFQKGVTNLEVTPDGSVTLNDVRASLSKVEGRS